MSNPLDTKEFEHWLNFKSDDIGLLQISEPVKFDASEFVITQDDKGYARDISFMAEEISLEFYEGFFEQGEEYQLPSGIIVDKLGHALEYILQYNSEYGFQSQIEYVLRRNGVDFILGELNFEGSVTDELTYFKCKVIQSTKRALARRREDTEIDGFATEDLDGNPIEPIATQNMLLQAKPVTQISEWTTPKDYVFQVGAGTNYFNFTNNVVDSNIDDTLSFIEDVYFDSSDTENFIYLEAKSDLSNVKVDIRNIEYLIDLAAPQVVSATFLIWYNVAPIFNYDGKTLIHEEFVNFVGVPNVHNFTYDGVTEIDAIANDNKLWIWFELRVVANNPFTSTDNFMFINNNGEINITATATAIDTVIKVVNYIDLAKQSLKAINGMDLLASDFESGGKFENLYATSGNLIRQRDDVPFYFNFKDRKENLALFNADIQINSEDAFCLQYDKFYDNVDNGSFVIDSSSESETSFNKRYMINLLEWKFKDYEKDRDEANTLDAVHTEAQFSINNDKVKNTKLINISDIFDPFKIESLRSQQFKETTALDGDDKVHVIDGVPIAPGTFKGFSSTMTHAIDSDNGNVRIIKNADLPSWALLGFNVDSPFEITFGLNVGTYTVAEIENTILTLTPVSPPLQIDSGLSYTTVEYPLENVAITNRTNEGFDLIDNLLNPNNFSNLKYTIRRNLVNWESYLSTSTLFIDDDIKNTKFKNNGELVTQFQGGDIYTEDGDIVLADIEPAILSTRIYDVTVKAEYDDVLALLQKYEDITTVGGFVRVKFTDGSTKKLHPQKLGYTWATKKLNIVGEERLDLGTVTITHSEGVITVDGREYSDDWGYESNGNYFAIYDNNLVKIVNFTLFSKFIVQEETFDNPIELAQALADIDGL